MFNYEQFLSHINLLTSESPIFILFGILFLTVLCLLVCLWIGEIVYRIEHKDDDKETEETNL
ncbi:hypothetical protein FACS1894188_07180 [Clostridia bacterium]|nr:hypothetical protein FACS1894188_07180 [Clostridia bacterium]